MHLVNVQLALVGAEFVTAMAKPTGPLSAVVVGSIDGHHVRLDFLTAPAPGMCVAVLVGKEEGLPERAAAPTFEGALQAYPWAAALDALAADQPG